MSRLISMGYKVVMVNGVISSLLGGIMIQEKLICYWLLADMLYIGKAG